MDDEGGGNLQNFQKNNNYLLEEESENSDQENKININDFSFKKKKSDSKEKIEEKEKNNNEDIASAFEEDLNQYYSKNKRSDVEKKFMKIQNAFIKKDEGTTSSSSMKNIFSSVKKLFS